MVRDNASSTIFLKHLFAFLHVSGVKRIKTLRLKAVKKAGWFSQEEVGLSPKLPLWLKVLTLEN